MALRGRIITPQDRAVAVLNRLRRACEYQILCLATSEHTWKQ